MLRRRCWAAPERRGAPLTQHRARLARWLAHGLAYGLLGLPLAFVALPLYVQLPNHYASEFGIPLATLGALLLGARLLDALADPLIGRWADGWLAHSARACAGGRRPGRLLLAVGFRGAVLPAGRRVPPCWSGAPALLAVTYLSYSVLACCTRPGAHGWAATRPACAHRRLARRPGAGGRAGGQRAAGAGRPVGDQCRVRIGRWMLGLALLAGGAAAAGWCRSGQALQPAAAAAHPGLSCACWRSTWSTAWPARCRPRWCCSSSATGCRRRPSSRCSWPATSPPGRCHAAVGAGRGALRPAALLAGRHGAGHRHLRLGGALGAGDVLAFTPWCAWPAAWRWAPTWRCPARCWPA
jgi:hypothetical protein